MILSMIQWTNHYRRDAEREKKEIEEEKKNLRYEMFFDQNNEYCDRYMYIYMSVGVCSLVG